MRNLRSFIASCIISSLTAAIKRRPPCADWCQEQRVPIDSRANRMYAATGDVYDFRRTPFMAALVFGFFNERWSRELILLKDSQSGASTHALFVVAWTMCNSPGNVIYIIDTRDKVREFAKDRMGPLFDGVPALRDRREEAVDSHAVGRSKRAQESTSMAMRFTGGVLYLGGGQSPTALVSTSASIVFLDEISKHPFVNDMSTLGLARSRVTGDNNSKIFAFSTPEDEVTFATDPNTKQEVPIESAETVSHMEFLKGTMEYCEVMCPHCRHWQTMEFENLIFGHCRETDSAGKGFWNYERVASETYLKCTNPFCTDKNEDGTTRGKIEEHHKKTWMSQPGNFRWVARNPNPVRGVRSATISALYNITFEQRSWGSIACYFLAAKAKESRPALKSFYTDVLGRPFPAAVTNAATYDKVIELKSEFWHRFSDRKEQEKNRLLPFTKDEMYFIGLLVDVQSENVKWQVIAYTKEGQQHTLDWGVANEIRDTDGYVDTWEWKTCDPDNRKQEDEAADLYAIRVVWIDTGHKTKMVYQFIAEMARKWWGICAWEGVRGMDQANNRFARVQPHWIEEYPVQNDQGIVIPGVTVTVNNIDAAYWEEELYINRIGEYQKGQESTAHPKITLPADVSEEFMRELCNMKREPKKMKGGRTKIMWVKVRAGANDQGDLCKYGCVMYYSLGFRDRQAGVGPEVGQMEAAAA